MNAYLVEKLRDGRIKKGLKQSDVTNLTGIKNTTLSNYENGNTEPDMDTFLQLCELYDLDYAEILETAYSYKSKSVDFLLGEKEKLIVKKYRDLDSHGTEMVDMVLEKEHKRWELEQEKSKVVAIRTELPEHIQVNAAHSRTDREITDEMRQHDDDLMNDDNLWK